jgi:hypothetical protein
LDYSDKDVKKYEPKKVHSKKMTQFTNSLEGGDEPSSELSEYKRNLRRRQEDYLFRGYGTMMDTSEMIDFSEGSDSY